MTAGLGVEQETGHGLLVCHDRPPLSRATQGCEEHAIAATVPGSAASGNPAHNAPAFTAMNLRKVELTAGAPRAYGKARSARDYWIKEIRDREAGYVARAERAYERMVAAWKPKPEKSTAR